MMVLAVILAGFLWMVRYRFQSRFMRAYMLFYTVLLVMVVNKGNKDTVNEFQGDNLGPLSLARWAVLGLLVLMALRMKVPPAFKTDALLGIMVLLFVVDSLLSSTYSDDFTYSFPRAAGFAMLGVGLLRGLAFYLHNNENCVGFFRFHYYIAWLVLLPALVFHFAGFDSFGVSMVMGRYAGAFDNQNMLGVFSALIVPYVVHHWRVEAKTPRQRWLDLALLGLIFFGLWISGSRGGLLAAVLAVATYFFVVNAESRLKIVAASVCLIGGLTAFPDLGSDLVSFARKETAKKVESSAITEQLYEERRFEIWSAVWPIFWKEKLTGYGFASSHLLAFPNAKDQESARHLHNSYLELFGDLGLIGTVLFLLVLYRLAQKGVTLTRRRAPPEERHLYAVFISIFVAGVVNAFFESWLFAAGNLLAIMFWAPVAGLVGQWAQRSVTVSDRAAVPAIGRLSYPGLQTQLK
jgi:O-antigen ligase